MSGLIGDLLEGIVDFVTDIWVARRKRAANGRPANSWGRDAADMAVFDVWAMVLTMLALTIGALMMFMLKLPLWLSLAPLAAVAAYIAYRWIALTRA